MDPADRKATQLAAHMSAFLTVHGWEYNRYSDVWTKEGVLQTVSQRISCRCGGCNDTEEVETGEFGLEDAYDNEAGRVHTVASVLES